jgi:hypothetical protein
MRFAAVSLVVVFALASGSAGAVTAVLPVDASGMGKDDARVHRDITEVMKEVLKRGFKAVPEKAAPDGGTRCTQTLDCLKNAAESVGADEVVHVKASRAAPSQGAEAWANVSLALFATDGTPLVTFTTVVTTTAAINDLRGIIVQAFDPAQYSGRVSVRGLVDGDELLLDGLRPDRPELALRAGPHKARVRHGDGSVVDVAFVVPFNGQAVVDVPAALPPGSFAPPSNWPAFAHAGVAAAGVVGVVAMIIREGIWRGSAEVLDGGTCPVGVVDDTGADFADEGVSAFGPCGAVQVEQHQWVQLNRDLHLSLGLAFGAVAVAGGTAAALTLLLEPPPAETTTTTILP